MQTSTIKFSQIKDRIDAEYYKPEYLELEKVLDNPRCLSDVIEISKDKINPTKNPNQEFCYLEIDNVNLFTGQVKKQKLLGRNAPSRARKKVEANDCILSTVRPNRNAVGFIDKDLANCIASTGFAVLRPKKILGGYLFALLKSKIVINQLVRLTSAAMYPAVSEEEIANIKIPIPSQSFQQKIEKIVKEAQEKRKLADEKYKEAEEILNKELGLDDLDLSTQKTFETKFSEAEDRFDPEYYQPKYKKIISKLKSLTFAKTSVGKQNSKPLGEIVKISNKKIDPNKNPSEEIKYVELANVDGSNGIIEDCETYKHWQLPGRARMIIKKGNVLVSSLGGSVDKVGLVTDEYDNQVASTGFFVVSSDVLNSETLFLIFRNKIISSQLEQNTRGAIMSAISENEFKNILIPPISKSAQQKTSSLIQESFKLRREAKELIEKAKREVEQMILA